MVRGALLVAALCASGCAFTPETVKLTPLFTPAPEPGADRIELKVKVDDLRLEPTEVVARKINGFGYQLAAITSDKPVAEVLAQAFTDALLARGYRVHDAAPITLAIELIVMSHEFRTGFWSGKSEAQVIFLATARDTAGAQIFRQVVGEKFDHPIQLATGDNVGKAYEGAITKAIEKLLSMAGFRDALKPPAPPAL